MADIVKKLKNINKDSLIMQVIRDSMDAAEEIEKLRAECAEKDQALKQIRKILRKGKKSH